MFYPIFRYPSFYQPLENIIVPLPELPTKPIEPSKENVNTWHIFIISAFLGFLMLVNGAPASVFGIILLIGLIGTFIMWIIKEIEVSNNYEKQKKQYQQDILKYNEKFSEYNRVIVLAKDPQYKLEYRKNKITEGLKKASKNVHLANPNKGASEQFFLKYINEWFGNYVLIDRSIYSDSILQYQPDFIFYDKGTNLHIDIEIDEPYSMKNHQPIHYLENGKRIDEARDLYFNSNGWFVLRFAEEQVVRQPNECCNFIRKVISEILGKQYIEEVKYELKSIKCWTKSEALESSRKNSREKYLTKIQEKQENIDDFFWLTENFSFQEHDDYLFEIIDSDYNDINNLFAEDVSQLKNNSIKIMQTIKNEQIEFSKNNEIQNFNESTGTFTDERDGNVYKWVRIGNQIWMAENLRYIPHVSPVREEGGIWVYDYDGTNVNMAKQTTNYEKFGCLYNWEKASTIPPKGWHLPSDKEWLILEKLLGIPNNEIEIIHSRGENSNIGNKLKSMDYGFNAKLCGLREPSVEINEEDYYISGTIPEFGSLGRTTYFWSNSLENELPICRVIQTNISGIDRWGLNKNYGFSVRCIKDLENIDFYELVDFYDLPIQEEDNFLKMLDNMVLDEDDLPFLNIDDNHSFKDDDISYSEGDDLPYKVPEEDEFDVLPW
jgi:uncharacterized protein (TIGR02145 family)